MYELYSYKPTDGARLNQPIIIFRFVPVEFLSTSTTDNCVMIIVHFQIICIIEDSDVFTPSPKYNFTYT